MNINRKRVGATLASLLFTLILSDGSIISSAQSGRGLMHGYVAFEDVSYNDMAKGGVHAAVELRTEQSGDRGAYTAKTNEHGSYDFPSIAMGEYTLRISAPGYTSYETRLYIPSDFECKLAVILKKKKP